MRPAVDSNSGDVARGVEASRAESARQLLADFTLHGFKRGVEQLHPAKAVLFPRRPPRLAWSLLHGDHDAFFRLTRTLVAANTHRMIEPKPSVIAARGVHGVRAQLLKRRPAVNQYVG